MNISTTPEIDALLKAGAPCAFGLSGGKDSALLALAGSEYLDGIGHTGPRVLIHADLLSGAGQQAINNVNDEGLDFR